MGQYFYIVNLDRREYLDPINLYAGRKLWEIAANNALSVLAFLLRQSTGRGGGDIRKPYEHAGRWAGDRIAIIGDYDDSGIYGLCSRGLYKEISAEILEEVNDFLELDSLRIPRKTAA